MSWLKNLFSANFTLTDDQRVAVRAALKKWGWMLGILVIAAMVVVGMQNPDPDSGVFFDIVQKLVFGLMRLVLAVFGWFLGIYLGYFAYQAVEASTAGSHTTKYEEVDPSDVKDAKVRNRGLLLVLMTTLGGFVMALALSGAGGR